jgi:hypothetical protein
MGLYTMKNALYLFAVVLLFSFAIAENKLPEDGCVTCHIDIDADFDVPIMTNIINDVHLNVGLSCSDCHGGNPEEFDDSDAAMWEDDSFVGAIDKKEQINICGSCHSNNLYMREFSTSIRTDQVAQYTTSQHGILHMKGDDKVATCVDCHGVHGIYKTTDPRSKVYPLNLPRTCSNCHSNSDYMEEYDIPTNQFEQFTESVHGDALLNKQDIYAPACNDCHGNHGAIPPNISHISDICGSCHVNNRDLFQESFHREYFLENEFHECEACHGNHNIKKPIDEMLAWSDESTCLECHDEDHEDAKELSLIFYNTIDSLKTKIETIEQLMLTAEQKGMEVSELYINLEEARKSLIQTRTTIHSFDELEVNKVADNGFVVLNEASVNIQEILGELKFRRTGLLIFSIIITISIITLYLMLKNIKKNRIDE